MRGLLVLALISVLAAPPAHAADIAGKARVIDGDTIVVAGERIRLRGIDAPEMDQECRSHKGIAYKCGVLAAKALAGIVGSQPVTCKDATRDRSGRLAAVCFIGWANINEQMVADGWAMADRNESDAYVRDENAARARNEGLWRGTFTPPWEWRKARGDGTRN